MAVAISVHNHFVIELFGGVVTLLFGIFSWYKGFRQMTELDLLLLILISMIALTHCSSLIEMHTEHTKKKCIHRQDKLWPRHFLKNIWKCILGRATLRPALVCDIISIRCAWGQQGNLTYLRYFVSPLSFSEPPIISIVRRTRQIIRYRATTTLRWLQIKQYTASNKEGVYKTNGNILKFDYVNYVTVYPTAVSENYSSSGMLYF